MHPLDSKTKAKRHPMYIRDKQRKNLWQGDLINAKKLIESGALDGHQEYIKHREDFEGYCVLTQTCDLVMSQKQSPKPFITLAVIRKLTDVFDKAEANRDTRQILRNIVEHQDNRYNYFYLYPDTRTGLTEPSVVDLRTTFALSSDLHYEQILGARRIGLREVYINKLGFMAGSLYFRIALEEFDKLNLGQTLEQHTSMLMGEIKERGRRLGTKEIPDDQHWEKLYNTCLDNPKLNDTETYELLEKQYSEIFIRTVRAELGAVLRLLKDRRFLTNDKSKLNELAPLLRKRRVRLHSANPALHAAYGNRGRDSRARSRPAHHSARPEAADPVGSVDAHAQ
jgi:hypothetical protein